jgi:flagellar motor switch protein FliM
MSVETVEKTSNIKELLTEAATLSVDQLPLLSVIFDRVGQQLAERLRGLSSALTHISVNGIDTARIGETLDSYDMRAVVGLYQVGGWDTRIQVGFDRDFVYTIMDLLLGGDGSEPPLEEARRLSNVEVQFSQFLFEFLGTALQGAFAAVEAPRFRLERTETRMDFASAGRRNQPAVVARFIMQAINRGGEMFIIIPQAALVPHRHKLARYTPRETAPADPGWQQKINDEVGRTEVSISAVAETRSMTLGDIANFRVGQVIRLDASTERPLKVMSRGQPLFWAFVGQNAGRYTLRIEDAVDQEAEFVNDVLSG